MINLKLLNEAQKRAVTKQQGKTFVVAGAGCGKTRVLTYRIAYLLEQGEHEDNIYAFTFTNKAANEMKERLEEILGRKTNVTLSTFHSFALSILKSFPEYIGFEKNFTIIDEDDKRKIIKEIIEQNNLALVEVDAIKYISKIKNLSQIHFKSLVENLSVLKVFYEYQERLRNSNRMDFDDLLYKLYEMLKDNQWLREGLSEGMTQILVDEAQDINKIQYELILLLGESSNNIFLVGDEDQCIYSFRGSDINCIKDFTVNRHAEVIKLEQNYRSTKTILEAANSVIKKNQNRIDKTLFTNYQDKNFKLVVANLESDYAEAVYITDLIKALIQRGYSYKDFVILYRNNNLSIPIEKQLLKEKLPFYIIGQTQFFKRKEIKILIDYLNLIINNNDSISLMNIINTPSRKIGEKTIQEIKRYDNYFEALKTLENEATISFYNFIKEESKQMNKLTPYEFINKFISKINYMDYLRKEPNSKTKIANVYTFIEMFKDLDYQNPKEEIIEFLNNLYLDNQKEKSLDGYIKLMTIHQSKGLEYKIVIIAGCNDGIIPSNKQDLKQFEEERRIFYVAITRAKERLYLLSGKRRINNGSIKDYMISPFILDIEKKIINYN